MATSTYLLSTVMMGVLVLGVAFVVARGRAWHSYRPQVFGRGERPATDDPFLWTLAFVVLLAVSLGGTLFVLGGGSTTLVMAGAGVLVAAFLVAGVYVTAKSNGHPHSHAVGEAVVTLGALVLLGVVGWLLTTAGA